MLLLLALATGVGCRAGEGTRLSDWDLRLEGEPATTPVALPSWLPLPDRHVSYRLSARVPVAAAWRGQELSLSVAHLPAKVELSVDGASVERTVGEHAVHYRAAGPHAWRIPRALTDRPHLDLVLTVEHTWTQSAWVGAAPVLGTWPLVSPRTRFSEGFVRWSSGAALGALLTAAFIALIMFLTPAPWGSSTRCAACATAVGRP